jgi:hypothetical protein
MTDGLPRYVMVPVPREYVLDVMRMVLFRAPEEDGDDSALDEASLRQLLSEVDDLARSLAAMVAKAAITNEPLSLGDAADVLEQDSQTIRATVRALNRHPLAAGRRIIRVQAEPAVGVLGNTGSVPHLAMRPDVAKVIRAASNAPGSAT